MEEYMNKGEFLAAVCDRTSLSKRDCKLCLDAIIEIIKNALKRGEDVTLSNFGKFKVSNIKAKQMYSFKTGQTEILDERRLPTFKASDNLKQIIK